MLPKIDQRESGLFQACAGQGTEETMTTGLLGVDGGGTSTEAWLADLAGNIIGRGRGGPSNAKAVGLETARRSLETAISSAFADAQLQPAPVEIACLGLAGFDRPDDRKILTGWSEEAGIARRLLLVNDGDLVVAAGTPDGWGVGVIAGTGSIAVGRDRDGRKARAGGWGHLIGDEGSAYRIVLDALRLVARRHDGREQSPPTPDPLAEKMCQALGVTEVSQIVSALYAPQFDRTRIASLAPAVLAACDLSPNDTHHLLGPASEHLAETVAAVARSLGWGRGHLPLGMAGSFLLSSEPLKSGLINGLASRGYAPEATPVPDPVRGAVILAARAQSTHP
jgi:N-acetylglucosamine kinase-like BadF-type ATPase